MNDMKGFWPEVEPAKPGKPGVYSTEGELKKRDLYKGDIAGVTKLCR
jgi:hypothetical protein